MKSASGRQVDAESSHSQSFSRRVVLPLLGAATLLVAFYAIFRGRLLDHGSLLGLNPFYLRWLVAYFLFGAAAILLMARAGTALATTTRARELASRFRSYPDLRFVVICSVLAAVTASLWRARVLLGMPLTDDEAAYRFTAELLASGRLWADSHPLKIFFDQSFLINDGKYYSQYFVGWPALLVPFVALGLGGWAAATFHGLGVAGVFFLTARILVEDRTGRSSSGAWPKLAAILAAASPLLLMTAATMLSHAACFAALSWCAYFLVRARRPDAATTDSGFASLLFCLAFFVRPQSALPVGGPLLAWWLWDLRRQDCSTQLRQVTAFALAALPVAVAFLAVNQAQTGSPWLPAYVRVHDYAADNLFRFTHFHPGQPYDFQANGWLAESKEQAVRLGQGILRFNFAAFGWPSSFALALLGLPCRRARPWLVSLAAAVALCFALPDPGVDVLGPVHYTELLLPLIMATTLASRHHARSASRDAVARSVSRVLGAGWPVPLLLASLAVSLFGYLPMRARSQRAIAHNVRQAIEVADVHGVERGIIFATRTFVRDCMYPGTQGFIQWWPVNDPDFEAPVLFANHITIEDDRRLQREYFPDRPGYFMAWTQDCEARLVPLEQDISSIPVGSELPTGLVGQPDAVQQGWLD